MMAIMEGRIVVRKGKVASWKVPYQVSRMTNGKGRQVFVADCALLHVALHGGSQIKAKKSMTYMIRTYLQVLVLMETLDDVLAEYGWRKQSVQAHDVASVTWIPPVTITAYAMAGSSA
jgi:hypothetical protein